MQIKISQARLSSQAPAFCGLDQPGTTSSAGLSVIRRTFLPSSVTTMISGFPSMTEVNARFVRPTWSLLGMAALSPMLVSVMTQLCGACRPVKKRGSSDAYAHPIVNEARNRPQRPDRRRIFNTQTADALPDWPISGRALPSCSAGVWR